MNPDVTVQVEPETSVDVTASTEKPSADVTDSAKKPRISVASSTTSSGDFALEDYWLKATGSPPEYQDVDGESALTRPDTTKHTRSQFSWVRTVIRGRSFSALPMVISVIWSALVVYFAWLASFRWPEAKRTDCRWFCTPLALESNTHSYVGFALFLLIGFRVNESHTRYMEAMKVWTSISGTTSSFAKYVVQAFPPGMFHPGDRVRILGFLVAFPVALKRELRDERDLRELKSVIAPEDLAELQRAPSMSSHALYVLSAYMLKAQKKESRFPQTFLVHLINWIADLASSADICLQIKRMPCAFSYVAHLRCFLALWLFFLPFTLVEAVSWGTPLIVAFITYGVVGIELNAAELENPFGKDYNDLPLGLITQQIREGVAATFRAAQAGSKRYVHEVSDIQPAEGDKHWLHESMDEEKNK